MSEKKDVDFKAMSDTYQILESRIHTELCKRPAKFEYKSIGGASRACARFERGSEEYYWALQRWCELVEEKTEQATTYTKAMELFLHAARNSDAEKHAFRNLIKRMCSKTQARDVHELMVANSFDDCTETLGMFVRHASRFFPK